MPSPDLDQFITDALTTAAHPGVTDVAPNPSGRDDAWTRVLVTFTDGSACYVNVEAVR